MLEIKPSKNWNIGMSLLAIPVVLLIYYFSRDLFFSGVALVLVVAGAFLNSKNRIILNDGKLTYISILGKKIISVENVGSIKLRSGAKQIILAFFNKNDEGGKGVLLRVYNISIYKNADLKNLLDEIVKINPTITLSDQVKNLMEGKFYMVTSFGDA